MYTPPEIIEAQTSLDETIEVSNKLWNIAIVLLLIVGLGQIAILYFIFHH